jgi:hypothetical protein
VVTEVIIKVRPTPEVQNFASFVFNEFDIGVEFMREVALKVRPTYWAESLFPVQIVSETRLGEESLTNAINIYLLAVLLKHAELKTFFVGIGFY